MADKTINQLTEDTSPTTDDYLASWDVGTGATKKITIANLLGLLRSGGTPWAWVSWSPTWTNVTVGNGTVSAAYGRVGNVVNARLRLTFGSTTTVAGSVFFSTPTTMVAYPSTSSSYPVGTFHYFLNAGGDNFGPAFINNGNTTTINIKVYNAASTYLAQTNLSSTVPFTFTTLSEILGQFAYESA